MTALLAAGYGAKRAAPTTALVGVLPSFAGFAGHALRVKLDPLLMLGATAAVIAGSQLGPRIMHRRLSSRAVRLSFALLLLGVAARMALEAWSG
ncbi:TSUP family transporter [Thiohalorhabdus sp.]|uniref:TSUP family transporter n=1 Tax=Thiohalorhabdus sp. TaxID=3094134 RepID=UPI002FC27585